MNLNITDNKIFYNRSNMNFYFNRISSSKPDLNLSPISSIDFSQGVSEISDDAQIQYGYIKEFQDSINPDDPEFIENYALRYAKIRSEILKESPEDEIDKKISLLDKSYNDAVNNAAERLSRNFQNFFDYSAMEWSEGTSASKTFDKEDFKNNVLSMSNEAMSIVKQAFKDNNLDTLQSDIDNKLSSIKSGTTVENMNYKDIEEVDSFLKSLPQFKHHMKEYFEDGTYSPVTDNWSTSDAADAINKQYNLAKDFLGSGNISNDTAKNVYNTVLKNISAYHKKFAFGFQSDKFQEEINKDDSYYRLLKSQYDKYDKKLEEAQGQNKMNMILIYLRMIDSCKDNLTQIKDKLKNDRDAKDKLSRNPETVVDTDAYKAISSLETFDENETA
ncbi:hypothetical protein ACSVC9_09295 [Clostridium sp. LBM24168]